MSTERELCFWRGGCWQQYEETKAWLSEGCMTVLPDGHVALPLCKDGNHVLKRLSTCCSSLLGPREFHSAGKQPVPCGFPSCLWTVICADLVHTCGAWERRPKA